MEIRNYNVSAYLHVGATNYTYFFHHGAFFSNYLGSMLEIGSNLKNSDGLINTLLYKGNAIFWLLYTFFLAAVRVFFFVGKKLTSAFGGKKKKFCPKLDFLITKKFFEISFGKILKILLMGDFRKDNFFINFLTWRYDFAMWAHTYM